MNIPGGSMVTMNNNTAQGGPVGSATMINQVSARQRADEVAEKRLNTYIFDYLCRSHHYELARTFSESLPINALPGKPRANGLDDSMDTDIKEDPKRPDGLPYPDIPVHTSEHAFLYDWWCQFWDIFGAARQKTPGANPMAEQYLQHNMNQTKLRQMQQNQLLNQTSGNNMLRMQQMGMGMPPNGLNNLQKAAFQQNRPGVPNAAMMQQKMMAQGNMQRDGTLGENRPQSPSAMGGNAPSPSKRPRTDDGGFNSGPAGRGQPMQGQLNNMNGGPNGAMLLQNGMPSEMPQQQMNTFAQNGPQKLEAMGPNGAVPGQMGGQNSMGFPAMSREELQTNGQNGSSQGNHALQDYQMQLMLLEQQNKKRLLMARQEQDNVSHVPGNTPGGQSGQYAQNMSPSGSRAGPSPNPNDQMRKVAGTPKMGQNLPGSPAMQGDMQNRGTPPGNVYHEMPGVLQHQQRMFNQANPMMGPGGPSSNPGFNNMQMPGGPINPQQMEQIRMNGGRLPNGQPWQANAQQMMQQGPQGQGTPQQRSMTMPPPPAPNNQEQQRTQPSSPAPAAAPPTPNQTAKANPKGKKEGAAKKQPQKAATKKGATASTPAESNDPPATSTPSTPITPMHQQSFNPNGKSNGQPPQAPTQPSQNTNHMDASFTDLVGQDPNNAFALDFAVEGPDVLENFDFDSFLHNTDDNQGFGSIDFMSNFDSLSAPETS